jgi:hypothetical protein
MTPSQENRAFWSFEDLALFLGAVFPAWLVGMLLVQFGKSLAPGPFANGAVRALVFQSAIYALLVGALYMVITFRYRRPFWQSMGCVAGAGSFLRGGAGTLVRRTSISRLSAAVVAAVPGALAGYPACGGWIRIAAWPAIAMVLAAIAPDRPGGNRLRVRSL